MDVKSQDRLEPEEVELSTNLQAHLEQTIKDCNRLIGLCIDYLATYNDLLSESSQGSRSPSPNMFATRDHFEDDFDDDDY